MAAASAVVAAAAAATDAAAEAAAAEAAAAKVKLPFPSVKELVRGVPFSLPSTRHVGASGGETDGSAPIYFRERCGNLARTFFRVNTWPLFSI